MSTEPMQLTIDGGEVPHKRRGPAPLTGAQREILRTLRAAGTIRTVTAGVILHAYREPACRDRPGRPEAGDGIGCCAYCSSDGTDAMKRLVARGLARKLARGLYGQVGS